MQSLTTVVDTVGLVDERVDWDRAAEWVSARVRESLEDHDGDGWRTVAGGNAPATHTGGHVFRDTIRSRPSDRSDGYYKPFYEFEDDLNRMRAKVRGLATLTAYMTGLRKALEVYTVGGEWTFEAEEMEPGTSPDGLLAAVQRVVDQNLERNHYVGVLDRQLHNDGREDGDTYLALYPTHDGLVDMRQLNADSNTEPLHKAELNRWLGLAEKEADWRFGVLTRFDERMGRIDHAQHLGYYFVFDDAASLWSYLPSWPQPHLRSTGNACAVQWKRNVPTTSKRGVSDYVPLQVDLEREAKLTENLGVGASILAAIPWIEKMPEGVDRETAQGRVHAALEEALSAVRDTTAQRHAGSTRALRMKAGTVPRIDHDSEYIAGPMGATRQPIYIQVAQHLGRRAGVTFLMPEYMITGDASGANYASTLVAESPFVKARQADQDSFGRFTEDVLWRCLRVAELAGKFRRWVPDFKALQQLVVLKINGPEVASRDRSALMSELQFLYSNQIIDANEVRVATDRPAKDELEGQTATPPMPFGGFGQPGSPLQGVQGGLGGAPVQTPTNQGGIRPEAVRVARRLLEGARRSEAGEGCGANAPGGGGFQTNNTCATGKNSPDSPVGRIVTSQLSRIDEIVERKRREKDYAVQFISLVVDGEPIAYVIDGHHSHEAARQDGVKPEWEDVTGDYEAEIGQLGATGFLDAHSFGEGWWELESGRPAW